MANGDDYDWTQGLESSDFSQAVIGGDLTGGMPNAEPFDWNQFATPAIDYLTNSYPVAQSPQMIQVAASPGTMIVPPFPRAPRRVAMTNTMAVLAAWAARGIRMTIPKLWVLIRRFGPQMLIGMGLLTVAALMELMATKRKRRRMNPGNVKALRRGMRRIKSFDRLAGKVNAMLHRTAGRRRSAPCRSCRKNPCSC